MAKVRELVLPEMERQGPIEAWIIDDTGFPKKGRHSVGVGRQYCGELGKQDNCQIAVTLSIANHHASLPAAYRLYLPKEWATDRIRRRKAGVPKEVTFKTKLAIALEQLRWASAAGLPRGVVLMDAGYGADTDLRTNITALGLSYVAGIMPQTSVWANDLGRAGEAMSEAESSLGEGNADSASRLPRTRARRLAQGAQGLAQSMQQQMGQGLGPGRSGRLGQPRAEQETDPLGRPLHGREYADDYTVKVPGEIDVQRGAELARAYASLHGSRQGISGPLSLLRFWPKKVRRRR